MADPLRIEKLRSDHAVAGFNCGQEELDRFLTRFALVNQLAGAAQTYVALDGEAMVGYYSLTVGEVANVDAPDRLKKGLARHPVPIMVLARLAVSTSASRPGDRCGVAQRRDATDEPGSGNCGHPCPRGSRQGRKRPRVLRAFWIHLLADRSTPPLFVGQGHQAHCRPLTVGWHQAYGEEPGLSCVEAPRRSRSRLRSVIIA